jgi:hypothetical protein
MYKCLDSKILSILTWGLHVNLHRRIESQTLESFISSYYPNTVCFGLTGDCEV